MKINKTIFFYLTILIMCLSLLTACSNAEVKTEVESMEEEQIPPIEESIVSDDSEAPVTCGEEDCDQPVSNEG